jgi:hypothetical protein
MVSLATKMAIFAVKVQFLNDSSPKGLKILKTKVR